MHIFTLPVLLLTLNKCFLSIEIILTHDVCVQLLGQFRDGIWVGGLMGKVAADSFSMWLANKAYLESLKNSERRDKKMGDQLPSILLRWLVLDGDLDPAWTEGLKSLYDGQQRLALANGEGVQLKGEGLEGDQKEEREEGEG